MAQPRQSYSGAVPPSVIVCARRVSGCAIVVFVGIGVSRCGGQGEASAELDAATSFDAGVPDAASERDDDRRKQRLG